jgi:cytochrome P450
MTSDVIAQMSFGESFHMLESGQKSPYFVALENAGINILLTDTLPYLMPLLKWLPLKPIQKLTRADDVVYQQGSVAVQNLRSKENSRRNLFSNIIEQADSRDKLNLTDDTVRAEAAMFMVAGSDTTAVTLTYLVWAVLKRPRLQRRLEDEVAALQPGFRDVGVASLPLLNSVIEETLRLYNPAAGPNYRLVPQEGATFQGYYLPKETIVATHAWVLHRDESVFPDPERFVAKKKKGCHHWKAFSLTENFCRFDETRFLNATAQVKAANVPFGIGSRSCLAPTLAKMELRLAAAVFFRECRGATLAPDMTDDDMTQRILFFVFPKGKRCDIVLNTKQ